MTTIATGVFKQLIAKKQTGLGVAASGASAQVFRRVTSTLDKKKASYKSNEIRTSLQRSDFRHGIISVDGQINGELSSGTYQKFIESTVRQLVQTAPTTGALTTVTAAVTSGAAGTFTRSAGSYITDGFKVGMVVRWTGWATTGVPNNSHNFLITALTALVMTVTALDGVAVGAKAAGDSVTCTIPGKHTFIPASGHSRDYWTIEHWFSDIAQDEVFTDCVFSGMDVKLPATGMATVNFNVMGLNMASGTTSTFTAPTGVSSGGNFDAVNGDVFVNGLPVALITGMDFSIKGNHSAPGGVVGSNVDPDILPGSFDISGNMTVLFADATMRDYFINETEVSIVCAFSAGNTATADVFSVCFPRCKVNGAARDDGEKGLSMTMPFVAIENVTAGTGFINSSVLIQDSQFV